MRRTVGLLFLMVVSAVFSWWLFLRPPAGATTAVARTDREDSPLTLEPRQAPSLPAVEKPVAELPPAPPPKEAGTPEGKPEDDAPVGEPKAEAEAEKKPRPAPEPETTRGDAMRAEMEAIAESEALIDRAEAEMRGQTQHGFHTTLHCAAQDQLRIARFFDEPVVLVPRSGLNPRASLYYRIDPRRPSRVETVRAALPLQRYRQYRNLFAFPYESLPKPLRELRRRVFVRGDIYLFAALIPAREWALVIARREGALLARNRSRGGAPRTLEDVRRFTMRYVPLAGEAYDIRVTEIHFADGERWKPERS